MYLIDSDLRSKTDLKCGGCNNITSDFYGVGTSKKNATDRFPKPEEGYGRGLCSWCMCQFLVKNKASIEGVE